MNWQLLWLALPFSVVFFLGHEAFVVRHAKATNLDLRGRWWFDKGWVCEWRVVKTKYISLLTCCTCGRQATWACDDEENSIKAGHRINRAIAAAGWLKKTIRAYCPDHTP